jgi:hypothetical protein
VPKVWIDSSGVGTTVALSAEVVTKQQLVMPGAFGAVGTTARRGHKLRVALVKGRVFQNKQHIRFNPELQVANGQQNSRGLVFSVVDFLEASRKCLFLLVGGQLRQEQGMANADFVGIEGFDRCGHKVNQLEARGDEHGRFAYPCADLFDAVFRFSQRQKPREPFSLLHRMNFGANQVFD